MGPIRRKERGFTLVELIFVLAIVLALASVFLPIAVSRLSDADTARVQGDLDAIAAALTAFFTDMKAFPACDSNDCDPLTNNNNNLKFLAFGAGSGNLSADYPADDPSLGTTATGAWILTSQDSTAPERNNAYNHLVVNNPNGDTNEGQAGFDYPTNRWRGPYIARLSLDPTRKTYIAHVGAMERNGTRIGNGRGWILSAGPNGVLETSTTGSSLGGDDLGYVFFNQ